MKFTPKHLDENVNVSRTHPLAELAWMLGGLVLLTGILFFALGVSADWAASKAPISFENWLGETALVQFPGEENSALNERLQALLESLPSDSPLHQYRFRVFLSEVEEINAVALPGGNIVVFAGLLAQVNSENELGMILAHELGHFAHRDHLRSLGRGLGLALASALLLGENNAASDLISNTLLSFRARYSQGQESAADAFGLQLLNARYGHAGGSTDFFARLANEAGSRIPYLLGSHPHPGARIENLNRLIAGRGYAIEEPQALGEELKALVKISANGTAP